MTTSLASRPCFRALRLERFFPSGVLGPVDLRAFFRLAASFLRLTGLGVVRLDVSGLGVAGLLAVGLGIDAHHLRNKNVTGDRRRWDVGVREAFGGSVEVVLVAFENRPG